MGILDWKKRKLLEDEDLFGEKWGEDEDTDKKNAKEDKEPNAVHGAQNSRRTFPGQDSHNLDKITNVDMRLIRIANSVADLGDKIAEFEKKIDSEIEGLNTKMDSLSALIQGTPKETMKEVRNVKILHPQAYKELKAAIGSRSEVKETDVIDANILGIIKSLGSVDSLALLQKVEAEKVCSKNTLYSHLEKLERIGLISKKRVGHKVMYSVTGEEEAPKEGKTVEEEEAESRGREEADRSI